MRIESSIKGWFAVVAVSVSAVSCDMLDITQDNKLSVSNMWKTAEQVEGSTYGIYSELRSNFVQSQINVFYWGELRVGEYMGAVVALQRMGRPRGDPEHDDGQHHLLRVVETLLGDRSGQRRAQIRARHRDPDDRRQAQLGDGTGLFRPCLRLFLGRAPVGRRAAEPAADRIGRPTRRPTPCVRRKPTSMRGSAPTSNRRWRSPTRSDRTSIWLRRRPC